MARILVVDDDKAMLLLVKKILAGDGHEVTVINDPWEVKAQKLCAYDLILLDVMMPGIDGFTLCREIRTLVDCPILFLTAKSEENSLVKGLETGADDYISKPFGKKELCARVNAHLRREHREHAVRLSFSRSYFNLSAKQFVVDGNEVPLTKSEYQICEYLAQNAGQVFSREQIYEKVFGYDGESSDTTIAMHIKNIRGKLEVLQYGPVKTVWGIGYKWEEK